MCGIAGIIGSGCDAASLELMVATLHHRGPDGDGVYVDPDGTAALGHNRLKIIDLSDAGRQPMSSEDGRFWIVFNGEVYNYRELRVEVGDYAYESQTDTEVVLAAFARWGEGCLERLNGMFAFLIWDRRERSLFAARDRFGVKPLYYVERPNGTLLLASEIKALHAGGVAPEPDPVSWATYFTHGLSDHSPRTFWEGVRSLPAGHLLTWKRDRLCVRRWYDLADRVGLDWDSRPEEIVREEYMALLKESVDLRFRADVPVGINLSGGLDSSTLLGLVQAVQGPESEVSAFTFVTGSSEYDELPWVEQMLRTTRHPSVVCHLSTEQVPELAESVQAHQDEPFGGLPTLAYARVFEEARRRGVIVLLDGQGMDEQWAGYDYYLSAGDQQGTSVVQGTSGKSPVRADCLTPEFRALGEPLAAPRPFPDGLRNLQLRDAGFTKIPRALRFNDRVSMRSSVELREPFLDYRLFELAVRQPADRKIRGSVGKWMLRRMTAELLPAGVVQAPKRPLQTPQREWLRGPLRGWAREKIEAAVEHYGDTWLSAAAVRDSWRQYLDRGADSSFFVWQWISLALMKQREAATTHV